MRDTLTFVTIGTIAGCAFALLIFWLAGKEFVRCPDMAFAVGFGLSVGGFIGLLAAVEKGGGA